MRLRNQVQTYSKKRAPYFMGVLAAVLLTVSFAACSAGNSTQQNQNPATSETVVEQVAEQMEGTNDTSTEAANAAATQPADQSATQPTDLSWRDQNFPVGAASNEWVHNDNGRKVVYLTIDDGPSARTPEVLDILDRYNAKATFFVVGHNPDDYHYIKEAYDRGHTIGLHTYSHDYAEVYSSVDAYFADLDRIGQVVKDQIGYVPCFIRFPGGSSNAISANYTPGIMSALVGEVQARGYQYYDWDVSFGDGSEHTADEMIGYVKEGMIDTNIVLLCHDSAAKQTTVEALPAVIEYYQGLGYTFEAIDRSTWTPHHGVSN